MALCLRVRRTPSWGVDPTGLAGYLVATAYNLVRMAKLLSVPITRYAHPYFPDDERTLHLRGSERYLPFYDPPIYGGADVYGFSMGAPTMLPHSVQEPS